MMKILNTWWRRRSVVAAASAVALVVPLAVLAGSDAAAGTNLVTNPGLESLGSNGFPTCWEQSGYGTNNYSFKVAHPGHIGSNAMQVKITSISSGDRKAMMLENPSCAPDVTPGHQYDLSVWYKSTTPDIVITTFR